ncbi:hypothetical protein [Nocardioides sp. MH1]|uniref:hypothetical protein n=1 Tax=Nocardioides sp. MH1 TaxID=3242490 RepID=UPI003522F67A
MSQPPYGVPPQQGQPVPQPGYPPAPPQGYPPAPPQGYPPAYAAGPGLPPPPPNKKRTVGLLMGFLTTFALLGFVLLVLLISKLD